MKGIVDVLPKKELHFKMKGEITSARPGLRSTEKRKSIWQKEKISKRYLL